MRSIVVFTLIASLFAVPSDHLQLRSVAPLADGSSLQSGRLTPSISWQASGILQAGCSPRAAIASCWAMKLTAKGELDPLRARSVIGADGMIVEGDFESSLESRDLEKRQTIRQRIEILSWPPSSDGNVNLYKWKYYLVPGVSSGSSFFHTMQLFSRKSGAFVFSFGPVNGRMTISDNVRPGCGGTCPSIALSAYEGRTMYHRLAVTWGPQGSIAYTVQDAGSSTILLSYNVPSGNVPSGGSLKTGLYRAAVSGMSPATAYVGDFDFSSR